MTRTFAKLFLLAAILSAAPQATAATLAPDAAQIRYSQALTGDATILVLPPGLARHLVRVFGDGGFVFDGREWSAGVPGSALSGIVGKGRRREVTVLLTAASGNPPPPPAVVPVPASGGLLLLALGLLCGMRASGRRAARQRAPRADRAPR